MTITVKAAGGISVDFPDGTDEDTIRNVMLRATGGDGTEAAPGPAKPQVSTLEAAGRGALQGATFGFSDELYAGARGAIDALSGGSFGTTYDRELAAVRSANERAKQAAPIAFMGGEIAGGLAVPLGAAGTAARGATLGARSLRSAKTGAAVGGAYGFGTAEGGSGSLVEQGIERAKSAVPAAATGFVVGGALPGAVDLASAALRYPRNAIEAYRRPQAAADMKVIEALARDAPPGMPASDAVRIAQERLARSQATKPDTMLADVGGQNTRDLLRVATNIPSRGSERLRASLDRRQTSQWTRIENDVAKTLADGNQFATAVDDATRRLSDLGKQQFDAAFARPWNVKATDDLARFVTERPYMRRLVEKTQENIEGMTGKTLDQLPPWEIMHRVKMQIDREISSIKRGQMDSKANWDLRSLVQLKSEFVELVGKKNPVYRAALYKYGDEAGLRSALERGADEFKSASAESLRRDLSKMTSAERRMYRIGAARSLFDEIERGNVTRDRTDALFSSPAIQKKLYALYPDQASRRDLQRRLILEARMADTRKAVQGGSTTARQLAGGEDAGQPIQGVAAAAAATSGRLQPAMQWLSRQVQAFNGMTPDVAEKVIERMMSRQSPALQLRLMAEVQRAAKEPAYRDALVRRITQAAAPIIAETTATSPARQ